MVLLQAGRMNICADYDSLHYGLRSEYILNDGDGIYEDLGSVNVVYTYSKGLEILLLPVLYLRSGQSCFCIWCVTQNRSSFLWLSQNGRRRKGL